MYNLSILSCYQKQGEIDSPEVGESQPQEVLGSLGTEISIARAVQVPTTCGLADTRPLWSGQQNGSRMAAERLQSGVLPCFLRHFIPFSPPRQRRSAPHLARGAACRWGSGNAHRRLPVSRVLGTATALGTQRPLPGRHLWHCSHSSQPGDTAGCPLRLAEQSPWPHCSWLSPPWAACSALLWKWHPSNFTFLPNTCFEKGVFISRAFAFNSQRNKISFNQLKRLQGNLVLWKMLPSNCFLLKGRKKLLNWCWV